MHAIRILIVDDSKDLGDQIKMIFEGDERFQVVAHVLHAQDIVKDVRQYTPDLILMDINMPKVSGLEAVKLIRAASIETPILMQTVFETDDYLFDSILAGANGYVLKNTPPHRLLEYAIEATQYGTPFSPGMAQKVLSFIRLHKKVVEAAESEAKLGSRSIDVLNLLAAGYSYKDIASQLHIGLDGVSYHVKKLYTVLHIHSREEIVNPGKWWYKYLKGF